MRALQNKRVDNSMKEEDDFLNKPPQVKPRQEFFAVAKQVEQIQKARVPRLESFSSEEILQKFFDLYADSATSSKNIDPLSQQREIDNFIRLNARKKRPKKKAVTFMEQSVTKMPPPLEDVDEKFFSPLVKQLSSTDMFKSSMAKLLTMTKFQSILRESLFYAVQQKKVSFIFVGPFGSIGSNLGCDTARKVPQSQTHICQLLQEDVSNCAKTVPHNVYKRCHGKVLCQIFGTLHSKDGIQSGSLVTAFGANHASRCQH